LPGHTGRFFVYSNLFIAVCAVLMVNQTSQLLLNSSPGIHLPAFVFFATLCSYSFHWYLTSSSVLPSPRITWLKKNHAVHLVLFFAGLAGSAVFFFYLLPIWPWLLVSAFVTFLYSAPKIPHQYFRALRKVAIGKTIFLAFVWMYVTTVLPVVESGAAWSSDFILFMISRFFLIYAICILFDLRDREDDKAAGIRSLITYLNETAISNLFVISLVLFSASTLWMLNYNHRIMDIILLLIPGFITATLFRYASRHFSDMLYYFVLDGLMALSALLMLIAGI
jgi:4-hydroxybenzoate polyprenyltransferase